MYTKELITLKDTRMKKHLFNRLGSTMLTMLAAYLFTACSAETEKLKGDMVIWYEQPATEWLDAMPIGNGKIAGMVFGETQLERIALNESSFWSGHPHDYNDPEAGKHFEYIKEQVFAGKYQEMDKYIDEHFYGKPVAQQAYQPLGDLWLQFPKVGEAVENYRRDLDMETGVTTTTYKAGNVTYRREVFVSYPDNVMVVHLTTDQPNSLDVQAELKSFYARNIEATPEKIVLDGRWNKPDIPRNAQSWLIADVEDEGTAFQTVLEARVRGGESSAEEGVLKITGANEATLILTASTSHVSYNDISGNPAAKNSEVLAAVQEKPFAELKQTHVDDFAGLMSRVHLTIGDPAMNNTPTDVRLAAMREGKQDSNMEALIFQFGRYSLAAASRAGGQASNLQGIWNQELLPPWGSKYTININIQMNYWPAEVTNLGETAQPLFDMIEETTETGAKTAKIYYGIDEGWVCHHNLDIWRGSAPVDAARFGMWPVGGAWLTRHIWEHYEYGQDIEFLKKYYPVLKGSAQFLSNLLTEHPATGYLVTPFSMSPEHGFLYDGVDTPGDKLAYVSPAPTMDIAIINDLFSHVIEATKILNVDADFAAKLSKQLKRLPPYRVNSLGVVQEWIYDFGSGAQGHNLSTNYPLFPGNSMLLRRESDQELIAAQNKWLDGRPARSHGFPSRWDMALWARLERGDKVAEFISAYSKGGVANNLHHASGSNQIDATAGHTAAVAEALIQSHAGEISLLPALPTIWPDGSVTGLRARGGYEVSMTWAAGKLTSAEISNPRGGTTLVRNGEQVQEVTVAPGKVTKLSFQ